MKTLFRRLTHSWLLSVLALLPLQADEWIRINQLGYLPHSIKVAVFLSEEETALSSFEVVDAFSGEVVRTLSQPQATGAYGRMHSTYRLDFSLVEQPGTYYLRAGRAESPRFAIHTHVYDGTADFLLQYMRQQRCGFNPYLKDSCHTHDAYITGHPTRNGEHIDVRGGWHDAADYLQYTTTSANAIYQMMMAYSEHPHAFADRYNAQGLPGSNGIPDIVDEIKWGLDWLDRMNPAPGELYNQIADDRDHASMRLPNQDKVDYGYGSGHGRPVYFCSGEPQVRGKFTNATTGVASTAGKFASCFARGARVLAPFYPDFATHIGSKAEAAYRAGVEKPGVCQTASVLSPYIYEEDNWTDDMELGAVELYQSTQESHYLNEAVEYARREPITPWMGADSARHYQWYPFLNVGHYHLARLGTPRLQREFLRNLRTGLERILEKAGNHPFLFGIPAIWCSNNLTVAALTQCRLYRLAGGDNRFAEMEAALRDWLFGCNPWGTTMIVGLPSYGDTPSQPHSAYAMHEGCNATGGLVDGPVYTTIFHSLRGVNLSGLPGKPGDTYERFQPEEMVYHDAIGDYSTNEPTMDGTASLTYYLAALQEEGVRQNGDAPHGDNNLYSAGGIIRGDSSLRQIALLFTAHEWADGAEDILTTLKKHGIKGSFFLTGYALEHHREVVKRLREEGHYIGSHSDRHLLYAPWENRDSLLVSREEFETDLLNSYSKLREAGIKPTDAPLFLPPYEYYNQQIADWTRSLGLQIVNFTPGTWSNADYTTPTMGRSYRSSKDIYEHILQVEKQEGLHGHLMLFHLGTDSARTDKFYHRWLNRLITTLQRRGYQFVPLRQAVGY